MGFLRVTEGSSGSLESLRVPQVSSGVLRFPKVLRDPQDFFVFLSVLQSSLGFLRAP